MIKNIIRSILSFIILAFTITISYSEDALTIETMQDIDSILKDIHKDPLSSIEELELKGDDISVKVLMYIIENRYEDWKIKIKSIQALSQIKNPIAIDLLIKVLKDSFLFDCPALKWHAAKALGNFSGYPKVEDALIDSLSEETIYVKESAIESLGRLQSKRAVNYIIPFLSDKSFALRISALKALEKIGDKNSIPFLKMAFEKESDSLIRNEYIKVLKNLDVEFDI